MELPGPAMTWIKLRDAIAAVLRRIFTVGPDPKRIRRQGIEPIRGQAMAEGTLIMLPSGQWAIAAPGREPVNIQAGEIFLLEVQGERKPMRVRMERKEGEWLAFFSGARSGRRAELRDGLMAAFFDRREHYAKALVEP